MSSSRARSGGGNDSSAQELLLQERLEVLLKRLRWTYAALWALNPHRRVLRWTRGYYSSSVDITSQGLGTASSQLEQLEYWFYTLYKSCTFAPGSGFVGRANLEGRHIWLIGDSVCQNAGSLEQSQFLNLAKIKTVVCISWLNTVLELGTTNFVEVSFQLMDQIQQLMCHDLLSVPPLQNDDERSVAPGFVLVSGSESTDHARQAVFKQQPADIEQALPLQLPDPAHQLNQGSSGSLIGQTSACHDINVDMSDPMWRSDMIFMEEQDLSLGVDLAAAWRAVGVGSENQKIISATAPQRASTSSSPGLMNLTTQGEDHQYPSAGSTNAAFAGRSTSSSVSTVSSHGSDHHGYSIHATRPAAAAINPVSTPQRLHQHIMQALSSPVSAINSRSPPPPPPDRTSSTTVRSQPHLEAISYTTVKHEPDYIGARTSGSAPIRNQNTSNLQRTTSCGDQYEIRNVLSVSEALETSTMQQGVLNPVSEVATDPISTIMDTQYSDRSNVSFHSWHHGRDPSCLNTSSVSNQTGEMMMNSLRKQGPASGKTIPRAGQLQRRHTVAGGDVLKEVETYQQELAAANNFKQACFLTKIQDSQEPGLEQMDTSSFGLRGRARAASHDDAALNHMMAERRRRVKQKENFATLRRLVPIISKADKASTLVDAVVYLKDLQNTIVEMKANEIDMVQRCEDLASKCMKLEEQNQKLVEILSTEKPPRGV